MKSVTAVCASNLNTVATGRVHRQRRDVENEEIQMYLSKLKELVPDIPKNRRLSKLEVIQYVIDYIGDLQFALESHPSVVVNVNNMIATGTTTTPTTPTSGVSRNVTNHHATTSPRQPLGVLAPNTIVPVPTSAPALESTTGSSHLEKSVPSDSRQVSC